MTTPNTPSEPAASDLKAKPQPRYFDHEGTCVHSNQDVIEKFCELQKFVWHEVIDPVQPADCFCTKPKTYEDGYRNDLAAFTFIERAAKEAVEKFKAQPAPPAVSGEVEELPDGDCHWTRRDGDWSIITGELSHSCRDAYAGWRGGEIVSGLLNDLPKGGWTRAVPASQLAALREQVAQAIAKYSVEVRDRRQLESKLTTAQEQVARLEREVGEARRYREIMEEAHGERLYAIEHLLDHFDDDGNLKGEGKWRLNSIRSCCKEFDEGSEKAEALFNGTQAGEPGGKGP